MEADAASLALLREVDGVSIVASSSWGVNDLGPFSLSAGGARRMGTGLYGLRTGGRRLFWCHVQTWWLRRRQLVHGNPIDCASHLTFL
jgi:hypothetical protein